MASPESEKAAGGFDRLPSDVIRWLVSKLAKEGELPLHSLSLSQREAASVLLSARMAQRKVADGIVYISRRPPSIFERLFTFGRAA